MNESPGQDLASPEVSKASGGAESDPQKKAPRERGKGSRRRRGGDDNRDPVPLSHLEHVAGSRGLRQGHPSLGPAHYRKATTVAGLDPDSLDREQAGAHEMLLLYASRSKEPIKHR